MHRLEGVPELLDGPLEDTPALIANLRDLRRLNRITGGTRLSVRAVRSFGEILSLIDVGTGAADIPVALIGDARGRGHALQVTATDSRPEVLAAARLATPTVARTDGLSLAVADGRALPYSDGAFAVAHSSLVLHHLS